jgi:hypothetical protein
MSKPKKIVADALKSRADLLKEMSALASKAHRLYLAKGEFDDEIEHALSITYFAQSWVYVAETRVLEPILKEDAKKAA